MTKSVECPACGYIAADKYKFCPRCHFNIETVYKDNIKSRGVCPECGSGEFTEHCIYSALKDNKYGGRINITVPKCVNCGWINNDVDTMTPQYE